ncbi:uncharacterized protein AC631_02128 [Debaryomyces fabryi]|uniref:Vacuolar-sorting protein SNF7 n=1 Tax=Debaryomyces fabryi TaxID=58627 RepID=A0A0V1Q0S9_9ASCO|nr:uncharacterized protein AC631_02128 [Debaryomyces fabryi]KSA02132.1 hypothetical protein AC631_02128 [Debaryomyces fabryi]CUM55348.1 unnamed protein product [Debaryomyces fabryi]
MTEVSQETKIEEFIRSNPHFPKSRLNSLYSNFENLKHLNPEGFEANIQAWSDLLISLLQSGLLAGSQVSINTFSPNIAQLLAIPVYGQPKGLGIILNELVQRRVLIPYSLYINATDSYVSIMNDSIKFTDYISPSKWLHWGIQQLRLTSIFTATNKKNELNKETYISWSILCAFGQKFVNEIQKEINVGIRSSSLFDKLSCYSYMKSIDPGLSPTDFEILLVYFSRDLGICKLKQQDNITCIKFLNEGNLNYISDEDIGIIRLKSTITAIEKRNEELEIKSVNISNNMKVLLKNRNSSNEIGTNIRLKNMLKSRREIHASLEKSSSALSQLNTALLKINDATSNKNIFDLLSESSKLLNALNESINLDDVDNLQIELEEGYDKTNAISESLSSSGTAYINEEELEDELDKLYAQESSNMEPVAANDSNNTNNNTEDDLELIRKLQDMKVSGKITNKEKKPLEAYN